MPFIYIDRRKAGKGKSSPNRQKLLKRIRAFIKHSNPQSLGAGGVGNVYNSGKAVNNPVKIASGALEEPWFSYARGGDTLIVIPGNTTYDRGDEIPVQSEEESQGGGGPGDGGEDDFVVNVASNEFLDLFFEDCELPNLDDEKAREKTEFQMTHAGFSRQGVPAQLSVIRTYKQALGRRRAIAGPYLKEIEELEATYKNLVELLADNEADDVICAEISERMTVIELRIGALRAKADAIAGFDKVDLRFRKKEPQPLKQVDAVLVMVMDVSGSMGQEEKTIARRWFALLYAFIKRRYEKTDLVFIAHTDEAYEMSEADFFSTRINGGTMVSSAVKKVNEIIKERYDPSHTNIYVAHASDGDNWESDTYATQEEMNSLMKKIQYFNYVEVGNKMGRYSFSSSSNTTLWDAFEAVHDRNTTKMSMAVLQAADDCYPVFKKMFKKK
jgi:uncharacterized protein